MNRHFFSLLSIVTIFISIGCSNSDKNLLSDVESISFDLDKTTNVFNLKTIVDTNSYQAITLESNEKCIIGNVSKIKFHHDTIFIVDKTSKCIFLFNKNGQYLSKICRMGRGSQEYLDLTDVLIAKDHILVLDNSQFKIYCYDFTGNFIYGFDSKEGFRITECEGKIFVCTAWGGGSLWKNHLLAEFDTTGRLINYHIKKSSKDDNLSNCDFNYFISKDNDFDILLPSKNIIYSYENGCLNPKYRIDFGKYEMPKEIVMKGVSYVMDNNLNDKYTYGAYKIIETENYRFVFSNFGQTHVLVYDICNKKIISNCFYTKIDDCPIFLMNGFVDNGMFSLWYDANLLCNFRDGIWSENPPCGIENILYQASKNLTDSDNGVIIRMKFKGNDED